MEPAAPYHLLLLALLLFCSAFVSGAEAALFSLNFLRLRHLESRYGARGRTVARVLADPKRLLATIILGNDLINIAASSLVGAYLMARFGDEGKWYAIGVMTFLLLIFGEIIPKTLGVTYPERIALAAAPAVSRIMILAAALDWMGRRISGPLAAVLGLEKKKKEKDLLTEEEFKSLVREGGRLGVLDREEEDIIYNILELGDIPVSDVMVPRTEMLAFEEDLPIGKALEILRGRPHSRVPVYRGDVDDVVGVLYAKDLLTARAEGGLKAEEAVKALAKPTFVVPESMKADELLVEFRNRRVHMALVVDEYGGTAGLVTMEDLLRRIFEDVSREAPPGEGLFQELGDGVWAVSGRIGLAEFNRRVGARFSEEEFNTLGGMLLHLFGRLPRRGEVVRAGDLVFKVVSVREQRIAGVRVERRGEAKRR